MKLIKLVVVSCFILTVLYSCEETVLEPTPVKILSITEEVNNNSELVLNNSNINRFTHLYYFNAELKINVLNNSPVEEVKIFGFFKDNKEKLVLEKANLSNNNLLIETSVRGENLLSYFQIIVFDGNGESNSIKVFVE